MSNIFLKFNTWPTTCPEKESLFLINLIDTCYMKRKSEKQSKNERKSKRETENYSLLFIFAIGFY